MPGPLPLLRTQDSREYPPPPCPWVSFPTLSPTLLPWGKPFIYPWRTPWRMWPRSTHQLAAELPNARMQCESKGAYHRLQGSVQGCQDNAPLPASWRAPLDALIFLYPALWPGLRIGGYGVGVSDLNVAEPFWILFLLVALSQQLSLLLL